MRRLFRTFLAISGAALILFFLPVGLLATTVKTRDGKIIQGQIRGMIVQKGEVRLEKSSEGTIHLVIYHMSNGENIDAIDEEGVHRSHLWLVTVSAVGGLPDDLEVFQPGEKAGLGAGRVSARGLKYTVLVFDFQPRVPSRNRLLGEFRTENGKQVVIPALHLTTPEGALDIPVADIIAFKPEAPKAQEAKSAAAPVEAAAPAAAPAAAKQPSSWQSKWEDFVAEFNACMDDKTCEPSSRFYGRTVAWEGSLEKFGDVITVKMGPPRLKDREGELSDFATVLLFPAKGFNRGPWTGVVPGTAVKFRGTLPPRGAELKAVELNSMGSRKFAFVQLVDAELLTERPTQK